MVDEKLMCPIARTVCYEDDGENETGCMFANPDSNTCLVREAIETIAAGTVNATGSLEATVSGAVNNYEQNWG